MEANGIRIRQAVDADAGRIARVHIDSWRATYDGIVAADYLARLDYDNREAHWHQILADRRQIAYVAHAPQGPIVGFASGGSARSGDSSHSGELYAIYIDEACKHRGLGRRLVAELCAWLFAQGRRSMLVWVLEENPSRGFYEALGGTELRSQTIEIGGQELVEVAYGWDDIAPLVDHY